MKKVLIDESLGQYRANLHCHTTISDGSKTPEEMKEFYKAHGYSAIAFTDRVYGEQRQVLARACGDFLVRRSDGVFAYQLAVVVDDAEMGVTEVVRGCDLLPSTPRQIYLQRLLELSQPSYAHVPLLLAPDRRRLAKRDHDLDMGELRERFGSPAPLLGWRAGATGLAPDTAPRTADELAASFSWDAVRAHRENHVISAEALPIA